VKSSGSSQRDPIAAIARSVLYEGYLLWPYRRSALKNQRRWTFGGVYPDAYSREGHLDDRSLVRTECIVECDGALDLDVTVRFLHIVERRVARIDDRGRERFADAVVVRGIRHVAWQEATERSVTLTIPSIDLECGVQIEQPIAIDVGEDRELLCEADGRTAGIIVRTWEAIDGSVRVDVQQAARHVARVRVDIRNDAPWHGESREATQRRTLIAAHVGLETSSGAFVSPLDPPSALRDIVADCENIGLWPALVGKEPDRHAMLSSPIILYDYPQVAPESSGDFFDAAEIDQLLVLSVLSMTEDEQARMRETDPRAREILERCQSMSSEDLLRLHGTTRDLRVIEDRA